MDLNAAIDIIIKDLREAGDIIDDLKKYQGVPLLQIELARAKCKSAAEVIALLKELKGNPEHAVENMPGSMANDPVRRETNQGKESITVNPSGKTEDSTVIVRNIVVNNPEEGKQEVERIQIAEYHAVREPEPEPIIREQAIRKQESGEAIRSPGPGQIAKPQEKLTLKKPPENAILADQFSNRAESFNEKIGSLKHEDDISQIMKTKPVTNLADAIGINDKFLFIREIFDGDAETYNDAIFRLNSAVNFDTARSLVAGYTKEDTDAGALGQLMDLLKRKFHPNE